MKKFLVILTISALVSCSKMPSAGSDDLFANPKVKTGPVVVSVNGTDIHQGLLDMLSEMNPRIKSQLDNPLTRKKLLGTLVEQQLLYQEAISQKLDKNEDLQIKAILNKHVLVSNALIEKELNTEVKKAYDDRKDKQFTKVKASIVAALFVPEDTQKKDKDKKAVDAKPTDAQKSAAMDKIKKMKDRLTKGEDFAAVAKEMSDDKMTKNKGGDAGQIAREDKRFGRLGLDKLTEAAFTLKKDQLSEVIEGVNGYYLVKVTSEPIVVPFDEAERVLKFEMQNTIKTKIVDGLKAKAKITYAVNEDKTEKTDEKPLPPNHPPMPTQTDGGTKQ